MNYPNNYCGECPIWLAIGEDITKEEAIDRYCNHCPSNIKTDTHYFPANYTIITNKNKDT